MAGGEGGKRVEEGVGLVSRMVHVPELCGVQGAAEASRV
jgi:hypothetical protein